MALCAEPLLCSVKLAGLHKGVRVEAKPARDIVFRLMRKKSKKIAKKQSARNRRPAKATSAKGTGRGIGVRGTNPERVHLILRKLDEAYPTATCALTHENPFQLLISTILSAQCTDVRVNQVTQMLYQKYPNAKAFAYANPAELEQDIRPTGFFRNKTKSIMGASKQIVEELRGEVPRTMEELLKLPGVARKTANVVLGTAFGIASGVVVDTHVLRVSRRLDLTKNTDPKKVEQDLINILPREKWILFSHQIIWHGRRVCHARNPKCIECNLETICYSKDKTV
jgi:endonuclease-3